MAAMGMSVRELLRAEGHAVRRAGWTIRSGPTSSCSTPCSPSDPDQPADRRDGVGTKLCRRRRSARAASGAEARAFTKEDGEVVEDSGRAGAGTG
jgi:hypothetical protein